MRGSLHDICSPPGPGEARLLAVREEAGSAGQVLNRKLAWLVLTEADTCEVEVSCFARFLDTSRALVGSCKQISDCKGQPKDSQV